MRIFPRSLKGQLIVTMLTAVLLSQILAVAVILTDWRSAIYSEWLRSIVVRTRSLIEVIEATPPELHAQVLNASGTRSVHYTIDPQPTVEETKDDDDDDILGANFEHLFGSKTDGVAFKVYHGLDRADRLRRYVREWVRDVEESVSGSMDDEDGPPHLIYTRLSAKLKDGSWLNVKFAPRPYTPPAWPLILHMLATAALLAITIIAIINRMTKPMKKLAKAASELGRGQFSQPLIEEGPSEVVDTIRAFNDMQARLTRFLHDRTRMLAAIGHDLRTPITSLKLRAEFIEDDEVRLKMLETLDDLHEMAEATLSFAREEGVQEETRLVNIAALVTSVCEDLADTGKPVSVDEFEPLTIRCRPAAIKRALRNVVENAVAYGSHATVSLARRNGDVEIDIDDQGPGIAPADMERVFHPFVRLESSRSRETGGAGLGLAIARTILRSHGGDLKLKNRSGGGLRATLLLPQSSDAGEHPAPADQSALSGAVISTVKKHVLPAQ